MGGGRLQRFHPATDIYLKLHHGINESLRAPTSGAQVIEGWHGVPFAKPLGRTRDTIDICRKVWSGDKVAHGYGWNREEMAQHGTRYGDRREILRDRILAMPHPPVVLGGAAGPKTAKDVAEFCDGWMPIGGRSFTSGSTEVRRACDDIGRDPQTIELGVFNAPPDEAKLTTLAEAGLTRAVVSMPQGARDEVLAALERVAPFLDALSDG